MTTSTSSMSSPRAATSVAISSGVSPLCMCQEDNLQYSVVQVFNART